jgi:hypothetical protein
VLGPLLENWLPLGTITTSAMKELWEANKRRMVALGLRNVSRSFSSNCLFSHWTGYTFPEKGEVRPIALLLEVNLKDLTLKYTEQCSRAKENVVQTWKWKYSWAPVNEV